jgi:hypothetical protein
MALTIRSHCSRNMIVGAWTPARGACCLLTTGFNNTTNNTSSSANDAKNNSGDHQEVPNDIKSICYEYHAILLIWVDVARKPTQRKSDSFLKIGGRTCSLLRCWRNAIFLWWLQMSWLERRKTVFAWKSGFCHKQPFLCCRVQRLPSLHLLTTKLEPQETLKVSPQPTSVATSIKCGCL